MALDFESGSTEAIVASSAVLTGTPLTMACHFYLEATQVQFLMALDNSGSLVNYFALLQGGPGVGSAFRAVTESSGAANGVGSTQPSLNTWHTGVGVFASDSSRVAWLDGSASSEGTTTVTPSGLGQTVVGARGGSGGPNNPSDARIAEAAIWNVALSDEEIAAYDRGVSPLLIRPSALVTYLPLVRASGGVIDVTGAVSFSINGTPTDAAHPRVFYPRRTVLSPVLTASNDVNVSATTDALTLTEQAATISYDVTVSAGTDALTLTEQAASISYDVTISAGVDALALTTNAATISYDVTVSAGTDALTLNELAASVSLGVDVSATTDALTLTEHSASIIADTLVNATTATLTLSEQAATVALDVTVSAGTDALTLSEQAASVSYDVTVSAATDALSLATLAASISAGVAVATLFPPHITTAEPRTWRVTTDRTWRTDSDRTWRTNG